MTLIKNYRTLINYSLIGMLIFFILKTISVMYFSSRNISLGFPFDSYGFDPFHRFTDYLLVWSHSSLKNMYDLSDQFFNNLKPAPYGYYQFLVLKMIPFKEYHYTKYINFLLILILFLYVNYKIFQTNADKESQNFLLFLTFISLNYPIFFLLDRGNVDIYTALLISILVYRSTLSNTEKYDNTGNALIIGIIIGFKPTFAIYIISLLMCFSYKNIFIGIFTALISYLLPIFIYGADLNYLFLSIVNARNSLGLPSIFCHNFACSLRAFYLNPNIYFSMVFSVIIFIFMTFILFRIHKSNIIKNKFVLNLLAVTTILLVANDPSPDYRIIFLIPFVFVIHLIISIENLSNKSFCLLILSIIAIFSFSNIYIKSFLNYFTVLRFLGIIVFCYLIVNNALRKDIN